MPSAKKWSPEEDREVIFGQGSLAEIAARIGRTPQAVYSRLHFIRSALQQSGRRKVVVVLGDVGRRRKYYESGCTNLENHRRAWTTDEERMITAQDRSNDHELAKTLGRTVRAIHDRRSLIQSRVEG